MLIRHLIDSTGFLAAVLGPLPLALAFGLASRCERPEEGLGQRLLVLLVAWTSIQLGFAVLLGWLHLLRPWSLFVGELALFCAGVWVLFKTRTPAHGGQLRAWSPPRLGSIEFIQLALLLALGAAMTWRALSWPTEGYDALAYHLPAMAHWYQSGSLSILDPAEQVYRFPLGGELLAAALTFPFRQDFAVPVANLLEWGILGLATIALSRKLGASRLHAVAAALILLACPDVLRRIGDAQVDLAFAGLFLAAAVFGIDAAERRDAVSGMLCLLCLALISGMKLSGPIYAIALVALLVIAALATRALAPIAAPARLRPWVVGGLVLGAVVAAPWYVRNWIQVGNPLGFIRAEMFGISLGSGHLDSDYLGSTSLLGVFEPGNPSHYGIMGRALLHALGWPYLLGAGLGALGLPLLLVGGGARIRPLGVLALLVATLLLYWLTPGAGALRAHDFELTIWVANTFRFAFPAMAVLCAGLGAVLTRLRTPAWLSLLFCLGSVGWALEHYLLRLSIWLAPAYGAAFVAALVLLAPWDRVGRMRRALPPVIGMAAGAVLLFGLSVAANQLRDDHRPLVYGKVHLQLKEELGDGGVVGHLWARHPYKLQGSSFGRRVVNVSPSSDDFESWMQELRNQGIQVIVLAEGHRNDTKLDGMIQFRRWIKSRARGRHFKALNEDFERGDAMLFRVSYPAPAPVPRS